MNHALSMQYNSDVLRALKMTSSTDEESQRLRSLDVSKEVRDWK